MKVKCITNLCRDIPSEVYEGIYGYNSEAQFQIEVGEISTVYAITTIKKHLWYLVGIEGLPDPMYYPFHLFEIIDKRISKYWIAKKGTDDYDNRIEILNFGFKEIVEEDFFYSELLDDNPRNKAIFKAYKQSMDNEFLVIDES